SLQTHLLSHWVRDKQAFTLEQAVRMLTLRSEEHTSELQSPCNLVCRLLLEKKKVALAQIDLALVCLSPRLIEALLEVVAVEHDKIYDGLEGDASALTFFHLPCRPAVYRHGYVMQCFH